MPTSSVFRPGWTKRANAALESLLYQLSIYGIPAVIGVMSLVLLLAFEAQYTASGASPLEFRVLEQTGEPLVPAQAMEQLSRLPAVTGHDTKLSESPYWFSFTLQPADSEERTNIEFPSRHAFDISCWNATSLSTLGDASRERATGQMQLAKAGFALELGRRQSQAALAGLGGG